MKIARLRKLQGMSQATLAQACRTSQQQIAKIESGLVDPRLSTLRTIASALHCEIGSLFFTKNEFLSEIASVIAEKKIKLGKTRLLEINTICTRERKIPSFHPFWEEIEIRNEKIGYKEKNK